MSVSVVIPTIGRNSITRAMQSVQNQKFIKAQIIIVDDSLKQDFEYSGVKVIKSGGSKGVSHARNIGILESTNEWIAFLDDDDYWNPIHLNNNLHYAKVHDLDFVISSAKVGSKKLIRPTQTLKVGENPFESLYGTPHLFRSKYYFPTAGYFLKNNLANSILFNETQIDRENLDFIYRSFKSGYRIEQSSVPTTIIDYSPVSSLNRMRLDSEYTWFKYLYEINPVFAFNFRIESIRNFMRVGKITSAWKMAFITSHLSN